MSTTDFSISPFVSTLPYVRMPDPSIDLSREVVPDVTDAHKAKIPQYVARAVKQIHTTEPHDFRAVCDLIPELYRIVGLSGSSDPKAIGPYPNSIVETICPFVAISVWVAAAAYWEMSHEAEAQNYRPREDHSTLEKHVRWVTHLATQVRPENVSHYDYGRIKSTDRFAFGDGRKTPDEIIYPTVFMVAREVCLKKLGILGNTTETKKYDDFVNEAKFKWSQAYNSGNEWYDWSMLYEFLRDEVGWRHPSLQRLPVVEALARVSGFRMHHDRFTIAADRPIVMHAMRQGGEDSTTYVPSCEDGPAIMTRSGAAVYYIRGFRLDYKTVMKPETLTIKEIHKVTDEDARGFMIERFGWPRYLKETNSKVLDEGPNDIEGTYEVLFNVPEPVNQNRLVCTCVTGKIASLSLPTSIQTREAARNYLIPPTFSAHSFPVRIVGRT